MIGENLFTIWIMIIPIIQIDIPCEILEWMDKYAFECMLWPELCEKLRTVELTVWVDKMILFIYLLFSFTLLSIINGIFGSFGYEILEFQCSYPHIVINLSFISYGKREWTHDDIYSSKNISQKDRWNFQTKTNLCFKCCGKTENENRLIWKEKFWSQR